MDQNKTKISSFYIQCAIFVLCMTEDYEWIKNIEFLMVKFVIFLMSQILCSSNVKFLKQI